MMNDITETTTELKPVYGHNKSYYGKATVTDYYDGNGRLIAKVLRSYNTPVIATIDGTVIKTTYADYSYTTHKHVYDFLQQVGRADIANLKSIRDDKVIPLSRVSFDEVIRRAETDHVTPVAVLAGSI